MTGRRRLLGETAERLAGDLVSRHGCRVLERNLRVGRGEIDLLIDTGRERAVVEVRSVAGERIPGGVDPVLALDEGKAGRVRRAAAALDPPIARVDLVAVRFHRAGVDLHWVPRVG